MTAVVKAKARTQNLILDAALKLARRGWHVFPVHWPIDNQCSCRNRNCSSPAKHPLTPNGFKDATLDTTVINEYWTKWPAANIGIATGALSGIIVIDVDSLDAEDQLKAALAPWDGLQSIPRSSTGRGCHLVFAYPGFEIKSRARLLPKIDVRADGGYFIVEPSKHISGKQYLWQVTPGAELPKMPAELLRLISNPSAADSNGIRERFDSRTIWEGINKGERDQEVFRYACWLRRLDVPADVAEKLILEAAARCNPPFSERAVLKKIEQAWKYSAGQSDRAIPADKLEPQLFETMDTVIEEEIDFLCGTRESHAQR